VSGLGLAWAGALYLWTKWDWLDPVASLAIATVIVVGTWQLFRQSLHVWAMSTTDIALSAHLVMPGGYPGEAFIDAVADTLHERFEISHPTIQIETSQRNHGCAPPVTLP